MFNIGPMELLLILLVALIVVGPRRLPEVGRSIGKGLRELRKAQDEVRETLTLELNEEPQEKPRRPPARSPAKAPPSREVEPPDEPAPQSDGSSAPDPSPSG